MCCVLYIILYVLHIIYYIIMSDGVLTSKHKEDERLVHETRNYVNSI